MYRSRERVEHIVSDSGSVFVRGRGTVDMLKDRSYDRLERDVVSCREALPSRRRRQAQGRRVGGDCGRGHVHALLWGGFALVVQVPHPGQQVALAAAIAGGLVAWRPRGRLLGQRGPRLRSVGVWRRVAETQETRVLSATVVRVLYH